MVRKLQRLRLSRFALVGVLVTLGALTVLPPAQATENYLGLWRTTCPDSASADNLESACTLCQAGSRSEFNGQIVSHTGNTYTVVPPMFSKT
jgi:hypothetical protein